MDDQPNDQEQAAEVRIEDQLRSIKADSWAYITEPNGWSYHTNIGVLAHKAVGHIVSLQQKAEALEEALQEWHDEMVSAINDTEHHLKDERNGIRMALACAHSNAILMAALAAQDGEQREG